MLERITVGLEERSYDIIIGEHLFSAICAYIDPLKVQKKLFVITDQTVADLYLEQLQNALAEGGYSIVPIILEPGEQSKSWDVLGGVVNRILREQPERKSALIALGGGVVGDLTGFAASITLRGINFIQIPTTLLAQVDSSVGGKTGINTAEGKNLLGSFYQPRLVLADISLLSTLPPRELLSGYAEVVKYGLIDNPEFFSWLEQQAENIKQGNVETIARCVKISCESKAAIVEADEREGGIRALLNFGHTFGHALEAETGFSSRLLHGEAVAIGMVMAFTLSVQLGLCPQEDLERVTAHFTQVGLPVSIYDIQNEWNLEALVSHMHQDKKVEDGKLVFILTKGIGKAYIDKNIEESAVKEMLEGLKTRGQHVERYSAETMQGWQR